MNSLDKDDKYDNPNVKQAWLDEQKENVKRYLSDESISFDKAPKIEWFLVPYISVWHIQTDLWIISGDLPTDYIQDTNITKASEAVKHFVNRWLEISNYLLKGKQHPDFPIGKSQDPEQLKEMGLLLRNRAKLFLKWIDEENIWS